MGFFQKFIQLFSQNAQTSQEAKGRDTTAPKQRGTTEIGIGLDFGTSCTKVVIQDMSTRRKYAIPAMDGDSNNPYLMPTVLSLTQDGIFNRAGEGIVIEDIKLKFLFGKKKTIHGIEHSGAEIATAYLAFVLRDTLRWIDENQAQYSGDNKIKFWLNIGLPAKNCTDEKLIIEFKQVALAAWFLAISGELIHLESIKKYLESSKRNFDKTGSGERNQFTPERINIVPEVIASMFGYVLSPACLDGMYYLIDVGSSTYDAVLFNVGRTDGIARYSIFETDVRQLGTTRYFRQILGKVDQLIESGDLDRSAVIHQTRDLWKINPLRDPIPPIDRSLRYGIREDDDFSRQCVNMVKSLVVNSIRRRNPKANEWDTGLPVFLTGGGRNIEFYREVLNLASDRIRNLHFNSFIMKDLEYPDNLIAPGLPFPQYHRMQIAYGLSFNPLLFGEILNKDEIDDLVMEIPVKDYTNRFIGQEMV
ncbi:MAG: hypothetical protein K9N36_08770 [Candidatus Marinimicrobia bacterium]|nr:hypothetical protein [Candidatus Neomarinimicrobiota bacterium]